MALSASTLANLIKQQVDAIDFESGEITNDQVTQAVAQAIVEHITSDAEVVISGGSSSGTYQVT